MNFAVSSHGGSGRNKDDAVRVVSPAQGWRGVDAASLERQWRHAFIINCHGPGIYNLLFTVRLPNRKRYCVACQYRDG